MVIDINKVRQKQRNARPEARAARLKWQQENSEAYRQSISQWHKKNKDKIKAAKLAWQKRNPEKHRESANKAARVRRKNNENTRISLQLRERTGKAAANGQRAGSGVRDLGCSVDQFWIWIESQFQKGMARNGGDVPFELDHVYPLTAANLKDRVEFLAAANWRNYQPLTPDQNRLKGDTVTDAARERFEVLANFLEVM
jgi:hypothetical protein